MGEFDAVGSLHPPNIICSLAASPLAILFRLKQRTAICPYAPIIRIDRARGRWKLYRLLFTAPIPPSTFARSFTSFFLVDSLTAHPAPPWGASPPLRTPPSFTSPTFPLPHPPLP